MRYGGIVGVIAASLLTAACGSTEAQRAATGGLTGLGVGALVGGPVGAVIGGLAGGAGGAIMPEGADTLALNAVHKEQNVASGAINRAGYGEPQAAQLEHSKQDATQRVKQAQEELQRQGFYHGPIDGIDGPQTREAITAYQNREGLQQTARLDRETLDRMNLPGSRTAQGKRYSGTEGSGSSTPGAMMTADQVRNQLQSNGYHNISDLQQQSDGSFDARADRGSTSYDLRVDGQNGRVLSQHRVAANQPQDNPSAPPNNAPPPNSANSPPVTNAPADAAPPSASPNSTDTSTSTGPSR
jgi:peptidoglycan hydrolase-like protein with peptidoglycan-binding domain